MKNKDPTVIFKSLGFEKVFYTTTDNQNVDMERQEKKKKERSSQNRWEMVWPWTNISGDKKKEVRDNKICWWAAGGGVRFLCLLTGAPEVKKFREKSIFKKGK